MSEVSTPIGLSAVLRKRQSTAERVAVWGGILLLIIATAAQARARFGYSTSLSRLQSLLAQDEGSEAVALPLASVEEHLAGWPAKAVRQVTPHQAVVTYSWRGLTSPYTISLPYDPTEQEPAVLGLETGDAPQPDYYGANSQLAETGTGDAAH